MTVNLNKHREALLAAWKDVLDDNSSTNWALFGYDGQTNDLKVVSKGDDGILELTEDLNTGKIMYAFLKVDDPKTSLPKYVLVNWQGEGAPTVRKGTCANHLRDVSNFFKGHHLTFNARTEEEMDAQVIIAKVANAGSAYSFKAPRSEISDQRTPVGTVYHKVIPGNEINAKERDQFWIKEEEEEKKRVAAEKLKRDQERLKNEEEIRARDAREAAERESVAEKRNQAIARRKAAEHSQELARRREEDHNETQRLLKEQEESAARSGVNASEALRRQRSREAKELIGHSTSQARAVFEQNTAEGQMHNKNVVPQKPVRNSVIAQRINNLTSQNSNESEPKSPTQVQTTISPPSETSPPAKTSPIKNIDKIKLSLESPSQIQQSIDPTISDLSPSEVNPIQFTSISPCNETANKSPSHSVPQNPEIKSNILENDIFDTSNSSGNDFEDDDSDNKFSTIKRSPHSKNNISEGSLEDKDDGNDQSRQNTVVENINYNGEGQTNGNSTPEDISPETLEDDGVLYQDMDDTGLTARALYDYQAADDSEITFDPGDIITHIDQIDEGWWQGLGPQGIFGLFPANYVELLPPAKPKH